MKYLILISIFVSSGVFAHDLALAPYVKMQDALASDDFKLALESHKFICDKELAHYKDNYKDCEQRFKNIEELRTSFRSLSEVYLENGNKKEMTKFQKSTCPMAKAKWIQKPGTLRNPYYGKSMLDCGEKI
jgi:hypothetical protein